MPPSWEAEQVFIGMYTMSHHVDWRYTKVNVSPRDVTSCTTCDEISQTPFSPTKRLGNQSLINVCIHGKVLRSKVTDRMQLDTPGGYPSRSRLPAGRAWERGYLEGGGKSNFLYCFGQKKEFITLNFFLCFLRKRKKEIKIACFAIPFMLSSEKGIHHSEFLFCFFQKKECFWKKTKGTCVSNSVFLFALGRKKEICCQSDFSFLVGQRMWNQLNPFSRKLIFNWTKSACTFHPTKKSIL